MAMAKFSTHKPTRSSGQPKAEHRMYKYLWFVLVADCVPEGHSVALLAAPVGSLLSPPPRQLLVQGTTQVYVTFNLKFNVRLTVIVSGLLSLRPPPPQLLVQGTTQVYVTFNLKFNICLAVIVSGLLSLRLPPPPPQLLVQGTTQVYVTFNLKFNVRLTVIVSGLLSLRPPPPPSS